MQKQSAVGNRRSVYRVQPKLGDLFIAVESQRGAHGVDGISDLSALGAALLLPLAEMPPLATEERVQLAIRSPHVDGSVLIDAIVVSRARGRHGWVYRFAFNDVEQALAAAYGPIFEAFNRRAAFRGVRATASAPIHAQVQPVLPCPSAPRFDVDVLNLSSGGLCAGTSLEVDEVLAGAEIINVRLRLPNTIEPIALGASVRYRAVDDTAVIYGLQFESAATPDYDAQIDVILAYLTSRFEPEPDSLLH